MEKLKELETFLSFLPNNRTKDINEEINNNNNKKLNKKRNRG